MTFSFSNCTTTLEQIVFWIPVIAFIPLFFSFIMVFSNQVYPESKKGKILFEIWGGVDVFFTSKYLNEKGAKWRPVLIISVIVEIISFCVLSFFELCL